MWSDTVPLCLICYFKDIEGVDLQRSHFKKNNMRCIKLGNSKKMGASPESKTFGFCVVLTTESAIDGKGDGLTGENLN